MSIVQTTPEVGACPDWCNAHTGFDDRSEDWHQSEPVTVAGVEFYVSTGTLSGEPEVFLLSITGPDSMSLGEAEKLAAALLAATKAATS